MTLEDIVTEYVRKERADSLSEFDKGRLDACREVLQMLKGEQPAGYLVEIEPAP